MNDASGGYINALSKVLIIGSGIAGLCLAFLLEQMGVYAEIVERATECKPVGGGITLTLNGMKLLNKMGLDLLVEEKGLVINSIKITNALNHTLSIFDVAQYADSFAKTVTIHRAELHQVLINKLSNTTINYNTTFSTIEQVGEKVKVVFSNGRVGCYDLVVGCDGMHSSLRKYLFEKHKVNYAGYACWRFVCDAIGIEYPKDELTEMWGNGKRFGIVPLKNNLVHCFASFNTRHPENFRQISVDKFRSLFSAFGGQVPLLLNKVNNKTKLLFNELEDVHVKKWSSGKIILIGDAAHGMTPNLTQGASMAIEDAFYLCNILKEGKPIIESLDRFEQLRQDRVSRIQHRSALLGKIGQWQSPFLVSIRNFCWKKMPNKWIQKDFEKLLIKNGCYEQ